MLYYINQQQCTANMFLATWLAGTLPMRIISPRSHISAKLHTMRCISTIDIFYLELCGPKMEHFCGAIFVIGHSHSGWYILQQDLERGREVPPRRQYCLPPLQCPRIPPGTFFQPYSQNHTVPWYGMCIFYWKSNIYFLQCPINQVILCHLCPFHLCNLWFYRDTPLPVARVLLRVLLIEMWYSKPLK